MAKTTLFKIQMIGHYFIANGKKFQLYPFKFQNFVPVNVSILSHSSIFVSDYHSFDAWCCNSVPIFRSISMLLFAVRGSYEAETPHCALCIVFQNIVSESQSSQSVCTLHFVWLKCNGSFITWLVWYLFAIFKTRSSWLIVRLIFFSGKTNSQFLLEFLRQMFVLRCLRCCFSRFNRLSLTASTCVLCCNAVDRNKWMVVWHLGTMKKIQIGSNNSSVVLFWCIRTQIAIH